jgi:hypothetical protein
MIVVSSLRAKSCNRSNIIFPVSESRLPVGSSARMSFGLLAVYGVSDEDLCDEAEVNGACYVVARPAR